MSSSIKQNFLFNVLLNVSSVIFPLITAPYVSRVLEPDGVGLFNFSLTYANYFSFVAVLGIPTYGVREVSKYRDDKSKLQSFLSQMISITAISTLIITAIYLVTIFFIDQLSENSLIFFVSGFLIYISPFKISWFFKGLERFQFITIRSLIVRTISVICLFVFVKQKDDLIVYIIINILGTITGDIWNYFKMRRMGFKPHLTCRDLNKHMKPVLLLFASSIAVSVYVILDTLMLGFLKDYSEVGYYNSAAHLSKTILAVVTSLSVVAVPRVSYYLKEKEHSKIIELMNRSFSFVTFMAFPIACGLICVSPSLVPLFFGVKFSGAIIPLMILSLLIVAIGWNNLSGVQVLIGLGHDRLFLKSVLVGAFSNIILNGLLIPYCGAIGASISSVLAESLILVTSAFFVKKYTFIRLQKKSKKDAIKSLIGTIILIPLFFLVSVFFDGWPLVFTYIFVCVFVYFSFEAFVHNTTFDLVYDLIYRKIQSWIH